MTLAIALVIVAAVCLIVILRLAVSRSMQVSAEGIANHGPRGAAVVIHAQTKFVKAGTMKRWPFIKKI